VQTPTPPPPPLLLGDLDPFGDVTPQCPEDDWQPGVIFNSGI